MFEFDLTLLENPTSPTFLLKLFWFVFLNGGVLLFIPLILWGAFRVYMNIIQERYIRDSDYILISVSIPASAIPSMRAAEHVFTHFAGMHRSPSLIDVYLDGFIQQRVSLEIVSIGGETRFIVRFARAFRDLVEAAFYAQYPDAEITEVEDYAKEARLRFPNSEYDLWGTDLMLAAHPSIPIRTYEDFEDVVQKLYADPLKSLLETFATMQPDEQAWIQIILTPISQDWRKASLEQAKKIAGVKAKQKESILSKFFDLLGGLVEGFINAVGGWEGGGEHETKTELRSLMQFLTPGEQEQVKAIEKKTEKIGFKTKIRFVYIGKKGVFNKGRGASAVMGYFNQFGGLNSLKPEPQTKTQVNYFLRKTRTEWKKNRILKYFKCREAITMTGHGPVMNTAEIASLYHFPNTEEERVPTNVARSMSKKGEAPGDLPFDGILPGAAESAATSTGSASPPGAAPSNLPFIN